VRFSGATAFVSEGAVTLAAGFVFFFTMTPLRLFFASLLTGAACLAAGFTGAVGGAMTGGAEFAVLARAATALKMVL
jgi:hypothetical protein